MNNKHTTFTSRIKKIFSNIFTQLIKKWKTHYTKNISNQIFNYTPYIKPKREPSLRGLSPSHCAWQHSFFERKSWQWRLIGNPVTDLTGPRFEPQTSAPATNVLLLDQLLSLKNLLYRVTIIICFKLRSQIFTKHCYNAHNRVFL